MLARPSFIRRLLGVAFCIGLVGLAGCSGEGATDTNARAAAVDPPNLLTSRYIDRQVATHGDSAALREVLGFWRDIQYSDFSSAYARLAKDLRDRVSYASFKRILSTQQGRFLFLPRVKEVENRPDGARVFLLIQIESRPSPRDIPTAFDLKSERGSYRLASDPLNSLDVPPG